MARSGKVILAAGLLVALSFTARSAVAVGASGSGSSRAFGIRSASVTQAGRQLRWSVTLDHSFSGAGLARGRRLLCLLIERRASASVISELCVAPPRRPGGRLRLEFRWLTDVGAGGPRSVAAEIARSGPTELTASFAPDGIGVGYRSLRWQVKSAAMGAGCASSSSAGLPGCTILFPARPRLAPLHTPRLVGCVPSGPSLVFGGSRTRREIALTFDDGPWPDPPTIDFIDLLARYHVPATFFEIGDQISQYDPTGAIERRMLASGDMIGDHTWTHPDMVRQSRARQYSELKLTANAIHQATGFTPCLWRSPYGDTSPQLDSLARNLGFLTISWNIDPRDWSLPGVGSIERTVLDNARNGGIVEMHFGGGPRQETLDALPTIITTLRDRGYSFVTVAQMLGLRMIYG